MTTHGGAEASLIRPMVDRLQALVEIESSSDDAAGLLRCSDLLELWFSKVFGRPASRPNASQPHLLWRGSQPGVLLVGHFDTVWPTGTLADWPFTVEGSVARGPGVFDMKAGIIQMLAALEHLADLSSVSVLLTCDEETGSATSRALIESEAVRVGAVLVCEPSADGRAVKIARKGVAGYELKVRGRAAHAGLEPELGVNAVIELAHQILFLEKLAVNEAGTSVTPTIVTGGTTANSVPETASVLIDVRAWTRTELKRVDAALRGLGARLPESTLIVEGGVNRYPFEPDLAKDLLDLVRDAAADVGLQRPDGVRSGGASDGNLTAAAGVATLDGLGAVGAHPHARSEWVDVEAMPDQARLLAALIARIQARPEVLLNPTDAA